MDQKYIYLSGPMSNMPQLNHPAFNKATAKLRKAGYFVINPAELDGTVKDLKWTSCLRRDLIEICEKCWAIATLPNWKDSKGATLEGYVAKKLKMPIHTVEYWLER